MRANFHSHRADCVKKITIMVNKSGHGKIKFVRIADKEGQKKRLSGEGQAFKEELEERAQDALLIAVMMLS